MPQLHDSGSRAIQPSDQTHQHDFARIFGIENRVWCERHRYSGPMEPVMWR